MSSPRARAQSFTITPAICRAEYPAGGGNHVLHVSITESRAERDGYICQRGAARWYVTRNEDGWSAQRMSDAGVADNWFYRFDYPTRATLLASLGD